MKCVDCHHQHDDGYMRCNRCRHNHREANRRYREKHFKSCEHAGHPIWDGREYTEDEVEFMMAVEKYKREKRRPFPTSHEILAVAKSLGYRKVADESERTRETRRAEPRKRALETTCRDAS